jgi:hypothetical protein
MSYRVCADFTQHIEMDSGTTACDFLHKVTNISGFSSVHLCAFSNSHSAIAADTCVPSAIPTVQ